MTEIYLLSACLLPLLVLYQFFRGRMAVVEFPVLLAVSFAGWALPQFFALYFSHDVPLDMLNKALLMNVLCLAAACLGYQRARNPFSAFKIELSRSKLERFSFALFSMAFCFFLLLRRLPHEMVERSQWKGLPVAYLFFYGNLSVCTVVALFIAYEKKGGLSWRLKLMLAGGLFYYMILIVFGGRRTETLEAVFLVLCVLWFEKRFQPSRWVVASVAVILMLFFLAICQYRAVMASFSGERSWSEVFDIDFIDSFENAFSDTGSSEMKNCAVLIDSIDREGTFDFGLYQYNNLVQNFVPSQIFGEDFKQGLTVDLQRYKYEGQAFFNADSTRITGSTSGGVTDAFGSFWYFGCLEFFLIGWIMKKLYVGAMRGWLLPAVIYTVLLTSSLESITHGTKYMLLEGIHDLIFWGPLIWYVSRGSPAGRGSVVPAGFAR